MSYANHEVLPPIGAWFRPLVGRDQYNKKNVDDASKKALKAVSVLEEHLLVHTFLVGDRITLADLFTAGIISRGFQFFFDKQWREEHPSVTRWYETVYSQPIYSAVVDKPQLIDEAMKNVAPKSDKQEKPKKEQAKKQEPKPKPKAKEVDEDEEEEEDKPAPKPKHPIEALPKPTFALDDMKRSYSNEETREVALPFFWKSFNGEEYSLWKCNYKYNEELTQVFMSSNLVGMLCFSAFSFFSTNLVQVVSSLVWKLRANTSLAAPQSTASRMTLLSKAPLSSAARMKRLLSMSPQTTRASISSSSTPVRKKTKNSSTTNGAGISQLNWTERRTSGLMAKSSSREASVLSCRRSKDE